MKSCRFKVNKAITLLGLNHAPIRYLSLGGYGSPQEKDARFELYTRQKDFRGNPIGQPVLCSQHIIREADDPDEELQNLKLSNPLLIQPNVWYILIMHNAGDSKVYFVSNFAYIRFRNWWFIIACVV
jgi:hypothetical protein